MLPSKLKNMNLFNDGQSYVGQVAEVTLPKLGRNFEDFRGGGMNAAVKVDMGMQPLEMELTIGGLALQFLRQFGQAKASGVMLRFAGAYQADDTGQVKAVEVVVRGRHEELDMGGQKPGDDTEQKTKFAAVYYKLTVDGRVEAEIDVLNMVEVIDGVDRLAEQRAAIGV